MNYPYMQTFTIPPVEKEYTRRFARSSTGTGALAGGGAAEGSGEWVLDFGNIVIGEVTVMASGSGLLDVRYGEYPEELDAAPEQELSWYRFPRDAFSLTAQEQTFHSTGRRAFRYLRLRAAEPVCLRNVSVLHEAYPAGAAKPFCSEDEQLQQIYAMCVNTLRLCMQEYYEDGVKRDTFLWIGDARTEAQTAFHVFGDTALARRSLYMISACQREDGAIPACAVRGTNPALYERVRYLFRDHDHLQNSIGSWMVNSYMVDYICFLWEYFCNSGDLQTLRTLAPFALRTADYLMEKNPPETVSLTDILTDEHPNHINQSMSARTVYFAQMDEALGCLRKLLAQTGGQETRLDAWQARVRALLDAHLKDGILVEPAQEEWPACAFAAAQAFAVRSGYFSKEQGARAFEAIRERGFWPTTGYTLYPTLEALCRCGGTADALRRIRAWYGFMLDHGAVAAWEKLNLEHPERVLNDRTVSRCHGWSAGAAELLLRYI